MWTLQTWHSSTVLKRIWGPLVALSLYAILVRWLDVQLGGALTLPAYSVTVPSSAIGLLLVFRTNQANARLNNARDLWGGLSRNLVDAAQLISCSVQTGHEDAVADLGRLLVVRSQRSPVL